MRVYREEFYNIATKNYDSWHEVQKETPEAAKECIKDCKERAISQGYKPSEYIVVKITWERINDDEGNLIKITEITEKVDI